MCDGRPPRARRVGPLQLVALAPTAASLAARGAGGARGQVSVALLVSGVVASRFGLWVFDLAVSQLFQEGVAPADRGAVGAALEARHAVAQGASYASAIVIARPDQFGVHVGVSFAATALAAALFESYARSAKSEEEDEGIGRPQYTRCE